MDQKKFILAVAISLAIMLGYQTFIAPNLPKPAVVAVNQTEQPTPASPAGSPAAVAQAQLAAGAAEPPNVPRVAIDAPRVRGSISLLGARIDDLVLTDYRETLDQGSPFVRLLQRRWKDDPYYVQYGWLPVAGDAVKVPDNDTVWSAPPGATLTAKTPVILSWDNGAGLTFQIEIAVDSDYLFTVKQKVLNATGQPVKLFPWSRIRREYKPEVAGYYILFEGLYGVAGGTLKEMKYDDAKSGGEKKQGIAFESSGAGGWAGITDKYWLAALIPDQAVAQTLNFRHIEVHGDGYQVDYLTQDGQTAAPGGEASLASHLFAGAKLVHLLDRYQDELNLPHFDKAVDFGWFYFLTKPIFYAIDFLYGLIGNFGLAILAFTVFAKAVFFPLANYSYRSMSKMKLLGPKVAALRERLKDDPQRMQQEMMGLYKAEKVNPASGCLPMLVQIPVFFSLYKVIFVTIEMRQAPFFGWIHDLSVVDPTNVFNLFGLIPFDPTTIPQIGSLLHLGLWPLMMGVTMFLQQKLNPPPPDPVQARLFQFMPVIFTFMLANFPAGLVIYWSWNNLLSIGQQWLIMRRTKLDRPNLARA